MSRGDAEHVSEHKHGVQHREEPPAPLTVEQRLAKLEERIVVLEAQLHSAREANKPPNPAKFVSHASTGAAKS